MLDPAPVATVPAAAARVQAGACFGVGENGIAPM
jgi:hypothetical protein